MAYTEVSTNSAAYSAVNPSGSVWDNGVSQWDFNGNTYISVWDETTQSYTEATDNTVIWTEQ